MFGVVCVYKTIWNDWPCHHSISSINCSNVIPMNTLINVNGTRFRDMANLFNFVSMIFLSFAKPGVLSFTNLSVTGRMDILGWVTFTAQYKWKSSISWTLSE